MTNIQKAGWLSLLTVICWGFLNVSLRFLVVEYGCHPLTVACSNALFCALPLIMLGSHHADIKKIFLNKNTWLFGITQILKNICMIYAFVYISSTEANLLTNIEIVLSVLMSWFYLKRRPNFVDFTSMFLISGGCFILVAGLPVKIMLAATLWVFAGSFLTSLRAILAELHTENKKELSGRDRCGVTGWILLFSSVAFILFFVMLSGITALFPNEIVENTVILSSLPKLNEFIYLPTIIGGFVTGVIFYTPSMYAYFYSISLSNNEFFMMFRSFQAVCTYAVEYGFSLVTALPMIVLSSVDWFAAFTIIFSSLSMILVRSKRGKAFLKALNKR